MFGHFSVDKNRSENLKRRVKSTYGTKPIDNDDLGTKQYTDDILGKLGEDLRKISSLENKLTCIIRGQTALIKFLPKFWKRLKPLGLYI